MSLSVLQEMRESLRRSIEAGRELVAFKQTHSFITELSRTDEGLLQVAKNVRGGAYVDPWFCYLGETGEADARRWARGIVELSAWEGRPSVEIANELRRIYEEHYPDMGRGYDRIRFEEMVRMFAEDDFYKGHFLARQYVAFASLEEPVDS